MRFFKQAAVFAFSLLVSSLAVADHNSPFGAGWAPDPTGNHAAAVESNPGQQVQMNSIDRFNVDVERIRDLRESGMNMREQRSNLLTARRGLMEAGRGSRR